MLNSWPVIKSRAGKSGVSLAFGCEQGQTSGRTFELGISDWDIAFSSRARPRAADWMVTARVLRPQADSVVELFDFRPGSHKTGRRVLEQVT